MNVPISLFRFYESPLSSKSYKTHLTQPIVSDHIYKLLTILTNKPKPNSIN